MWLPICSALMKAGSEQEPNRWKQGKQISSFGEEERSHKTLRLFCQTFFCVLCGPQGKHWCHSHTQSQGLKCVCVFAYLCEGQKPVHNSIGEQEDILMSSFQWKGEGMDWVWNFPIRLQTNSHTYTCTQMHTHAVRALRPVIVPAGVTRCAPLFWPFI